MKMRLDTLARMKGAVQLYQTLGFTPIAPYCHNPDPTALYLELPLGSSGRQLPPGPPPCVDGHH